MAEAGSSIPRMIYADASGQVFDHPGLRMAVFDGYCIREPRPDELVRLPPGSDVYLLPARLPLGFSGKKGHLVEFAGEGDGQITAACAFLAPAYLRLTHPAYRTLPGARILPLFAYAPLGWADGTFWTTALRIDPEPRQDPDRFDMTRIRNGVAQDVLAYPSNRLLLQLRRCALEYGCRAAQNFFLRRWECPLPTAQECSARCVGCISKQEGEIPPTQPRLDFLPSPREVAEVTLMHFGRVERPIASFGQGCEGEPLSRGAALVEAVRLVREKDSTGTVNLNTNASRPDLIDELLAAGLSSIRVSMASPTESLYNLYHRPQSYAFSHVVESLRIARRRGAFVSINLLAFPGLTDRTSEVERLEALIGEHGVGMIQWRNLNIDPEHHLDVLGRGEGGIGMKAMVERVRARFPSLRHGYFNPFVPGGQPPRAGAQP